MPSTPEKMKELRRERREKSLCVGCGVPISVKTRCDACNKKHKEHGDRRNIRLALEGRCRCGRNLDTNNATCSFCASRRKAYSKIRTPESTKKSWLKSRYNLTLESFSKMKTDQNNICVICGKLRGKSDLVIDHCHKTGKVRGLICHNCNVGLGYFEDNPDLLELAKKYLQDRCS